MRLSMMARAVGWAMGALTSLTTVLAAQPVPLGDELVVDPGAVAMACPAIAAGPDGDALLLWTRYPVTVVDNATARVVFADGTLGESMHVGEGSTPSPDLHPAIAVGQGYLALWNEPPWAATPRRPQGQYSHRSVRLGPQGARLAERRVGHGDAAVSPRPVGGFVAVRAPRKPGVLTLQLFDAKGRATTPVAEIARSSVGLRGIFHLAGGGFTVAWDVGFRSHLSGVFARRFDRLGRPLTGAVSLLPPASAGEYASVHLDQEAGGSLAVVSQEQVAALRLFDRDFRLTAGPVLLEGTLARPIAVAVAPDGRVLVVGSAGPRATQLLGRVFSPDGQPLGGDVVISTSSDAWPIHCATAAWTTAGWVVGWMRGDWWPLRHFQVAARRLAP